MKIPIYQVDAFTSKIFSGNPAAVCPLESWLDDQTMMNIAAENNLSETAFFVRENSFYRLRWFTPVSEVDLCGHATLASAFVLFNDLRYQDEEIFFETQSGTLSVKREGGLLALNFPTRMPVPCKPPDNLIKALGVQPTAVLRWHDYLCVLESEDQVRGLIPNQELLKTLDADVMVTARGKSCDFVSRFFAPLYGIPEDPVTGMTHCTLIPYWAEQLGKTKLLAHQVSKRGGELHCELQGERVKIAGQAVKYMEGVIEI